jgi:hypothetical protein
MARTKPSRDRLGLRIIRDLTPDLPPAYQPPRACDDEVLVCHGTIYAFPVWEISHKTGLIKLYDTDPATGRHRLDRAGRPILAGQVPHVDLARPDARPRIVIGYVGQTIRPLEVREAEHVEDKSWADLIAGRAIVVAEGMWNKAERDRWEITAIAEAKPLFNKEYNEGNPARIEIWRQIELRHVRDDALKRPCWLPLDQRTELALRVAELDVVGAGMDGREPRYPLTVLGQALAGAAGWMWSRPWICTATGLLVLWTALLAGALYVLRQWDWPADGAWLGAAVVATVLTAGLGGGRRKKRRRRKR